MNTRTKLLPFDLATNAIPAFLREQKRWAPWKGVWNEKRQKWDKIPLSPTNPKRRISTASPEKWGSYDQAIAALRANPGLSGIGFCMTGVENLVGIDLDGCVDRDTGMLTTWAQTIVDTVCSYAELSPSGTGLRIFTHGAVAADFTNHKAGVEVYQGNHPRFLTVTGVRLDGVPGQVQQAAPDSLEWLTESYREKIAAEKGEAGARPLMLTPDEIPDITTLELKPVVRDFLNGHLDADISDRSRALQHAAVALFKAGLNDAQVQAVLVSNHHAMEIALEHRRQDPERAEAYLWKHHTVAARELLATTGSLLKLEDFDLSLGLDDDEAEFDREQAEISAQLAGGASPETVGDKGGSDVEFEAVTDAEIAALPEAKEKKSKHKYKLQQAGKFAYTNLSMRWMIEGFLPKAELGTVFGPSGSGKTFFVLDMLVHMAAKRMWCGHRVPMAFSIVYIAAEGAAGLRLRIRAICARLNIDPHELPLYVIDAAPNMLEKEDVKALVESVRAQVGNVDLVVADTISQVTAGANENSSEDMGRALAHFKLIGKALKAMVLMIGHTGKDTGRGQRGWSGIRGALDVEIEVVRGVTFRSATLTKVKDGEGEGKEYIFDLKTVTIEAMVEEDELVGPELKTMSTCVCEFQLDPGIIAMLKEDEEKALAKKRNEKRAENKEAQEANGMKGGHKYLRDVLEAMALAGRATAPESEVWRKAEEAYWKDHPDASKGAWRKAKHDLLQVGFAKFAALEDGRFRLLNPPGKEELPAPEGDE